MKDALIVQLQAIVGVDQVLTAPGDTAPYLVDWRGNYRGNACAVVRPGSTDEVAAVVRACAAQRVPMVPQGGNTGLVGGGIPDESGRAIVVSLSRMQRVRAVDRVNNTLVVEAGVTLARVQAAARDADRLFPLSLAAEGSCTIGGNLSTNAGGTAVLRYGNARDLVLGIEAVMPDGRIWKGLKALRKDNTGYDLKHLLMGAEGTLGIITAAALKLFPRPRSRCTALVAAASPADAVALLSSVQGVLGDRLVGFELMSRLALALVLKHFPDRYDSFASQQPWQVLIEIADTRQDATLVEDLAAILATDIGQKDMDDAIVATSDTQSAALWALREAIPEAEKREGKSVKHDISLPISCIAEFIERADRALSQAFLNAKIVCFGHLGDGNLHYNLSFPGAAPTAEQTHETNRIVYDLLDEMAGSISAEHGLGQLKREEIVRHKSSVELDIMRAIKHALDPHQLMNPGKVL